MNAYVQAVCNELVSALLAGGAQGLLIVGLVWAALKVLRRANAATRHVVWFATLLVVTSLPVAIFVRPHADGIKTRVQSWRELTHSTPIVPSVAAEPIETESAPAVAPVETDFAPQLEEAPASGPIAFEFLPDSAPQPSPFSLWELTIPPRVATIFIAFCVILAAIRLGGLAGQIFVLHSYKKRASAASPEAQALYLAVHKRMALDRHPRLLVSDEISAPMAAGFFRPAVMIPEALAECATASQLEAVFRHELAHVARRDDWANLLQQALAAVFFFHPGVQFVSRRLSAEREIACDDYALAGLRAPRDYALLLTEFASRMKGRDFSAAPAAWSSNSQLKERIGMILDVRRNASPRVSRVGASAIAAATIAAALAVMISAPRIVLAGETSASAAPSAAEDTATITTTTRAVSDDGTVTTTVETKSADEPAVVTRSTHNHAPRAATATISSAPAAPVGVIALTAPPAPNAPGAVPALPALAGNRLWVAQASELTPPPPPRPRARAKRLAEDDDDIERRLDRLERLVESLAKHNKTEVRVEKHNFDQLPADVQTQVKVEVERARREADRARREAEKAVRELDVDGIKKHAMEDVHRRIEIQMQDQKMVMNHESLKARRKELEMHRKELDHEIAQLEKEMAEEDQNRDKARQERDRARQERDKQREKADKEREKSDKDREKADKEREKSSEKSENKHRDTSGDNSSSNSNSNFSTSSADNKPAK